MDQSTAKTFRNRKLRLVGNRMSELREIREESYVKNKSGIDESIDELVTSICVTNPLNPDALTKTFNHVIDSLFYKRPSKKIIAFLNDLACYPPDVIYEAVLRYSAYLNDENKRKKISVQYFMGFVRNQLFKFKEEKATRKTKSDAWRLPDDL